MNLAETRAVVRQSAVIHPDWKPADHVGFLAVECDTYTTIQRVEWWLREPSLLEAQRLAAQRAPLEQINAALAG